MARPAASGSAGRKRGGPCTRRASCPRTWSRQEYRCRPRRRPRRRPLPRAEIPISRFRSRTATARRRRPSSRCSGATPARWRRSRRCSATPSWRRHRGFSVDRPEKTRETARRMRASYPGTGLCSPASVFPRRFSGSKEKHTTPARNACRVCASFSSSSSSNDPNDSSTASHASSRVSSFTKHKSSCTSFAHVLSASTPLIFPNGPVAQPSRSGKKTPPRSSSRTYRSGIPRRKPIAHQREQRLRRGRSGLVPHHARAFVAFVFGVFVPIDQRVAQAHLARPAGFTIAFVVADAVGVILGEEILLEPVPALVQGCQARARGDAPGGPEEPAGSGRARRGESLERERRAATFARRRGGGRRRRR